MGEGGGREADKANTLHTKQGYLAMTTTSIFWKQNWLPTTSKDSHRAAYPKDILCLPASLDNAVIITRKRYKFRHSLSIHQLLLPQPGNPFGLKMEVLYH